LPRGHRPTPMGPTCSRRSFRRKNDLRTTWQPHLQRSTSMAKNNLTPCCLWGGPIKPNGYGHAVLLGKQTQAHRVAWTVFRGLIPEGMLVLHKCNVRACVNPDHLYIGTQKDNCQDTIRAGNHYSKDRGKTHCKHGHEFTAENTYLYQRDTHKLRVCKTCIFIRQKERRCAAH